MKRWLFLGLLSLAAWSKPVPPVTPPGQVQPLAPGQRPAPTLPQLHWAGRPAEIRRVEWAANARLEVAHALILSDSPDPRRWRTLAHQAVAGAYRARPSLDEVDVSLYAARGYAGFGGPPPRLTASVPKARLQDFLTNPAFDRLYVAGATDQAAGQHGRELRPTFHGSPEELQDQKTAQSEGLRLGGVHNGLFFGGNPHRRAAALTFDDAPHPLFEPLLLDDLRQAGVKATFFCIGRNARAYPYFIRDMARDGHEVANHTYHHVRLPKLPADQVESELTTAAAVLHQLSGQPIRFFRPPGGEYSARTLQLTRALGMITAFWTDDPGDFDNVGERLVESRLEQHLRPGGIILLHDNVLDTVHILPEFLRIAREREYRIGTLGELMREASEPAVSR